MESGSVSIYASRDELFKPKRLANHAGRTCIAKKKKTVTSSMIGLRASSRLGLRASCRLRANAESQSRRAHIDQPSKIPSGGVPRGTDSPTLRNPLGGLLHGKLSTNREKSRWRDSSQEHIEEPLKFLPSCRVTRKRTMFLHLMFRKMRTAKSRPRIWNPLENSPRL